MGYFGNRQQSKLHFAKPLIAACFLLFAVHDLSAGEETCTYENLRYEFYIAASCDYFDRFDAIIEADNGDGILLRSAAEGLEIRVYGSFVRETEQLVETHSAGLNLHPTFKLLGSQSISTASDRSVGVLIEPVARNYVTITVMAKSESAPLDDLWAEVGNILDRVRSK